MLWDKSCNLYWYWFGNRYRLLFFYGISLELLLWLLEIATPTLLTKKLISKWLTLSEISSNFLWENFEKSETMITVFKLGYCLSSYELSVWSFSYDLEMRTRLKPNLASSKQNPFPIPSVHPVTIHHDPIPYFYAHLLFSVVMKIFMKEHSVHISLATITRPAM